MPLLGLARPQGELGQGLGLSGLGALRAQGLGLSGLGFRGFRTDRA